MKQLFLLLLLCAMAACKDSATEKKKTSSLHDGHKMSEDAKGYPDSVNMGFITEDTLKGSPPRTAMLTVHGTHVHIEYNSPGVRNRVIWGGLVAYGQVWATGAHNATRVTFYKDVLINNKTIPKGTYAIFSIPGQSEWVIILNKNYEQHLADEYDEKEDVVRLNVKPEEHPFTPRLTFAVEEQEGIDGVINILWEKVKIALPFKTIAG